MIWIVYQTFFANVWNVNWKLLQNTLFNCYCRTCGLLQLHGLKGDMHNQLLCRKWWILTHYTSHSPSSPSPHTLSKTSPACVHTDMSWTIAITLVERHKNTTAYYTFVVLPSPAEETLAKDLRLWTRSLWRISSYCSQSCKHIIINVGKCLWSTSFARFIITFISRPTLYSLWLHLFSGFIGLF